MTGVQTCALPIFFIVFFKKPALMVEQKPHFSPESQHQLPKIRSRYPSKTCILKNFLKSPPKLPAQMIDSVTSGKTRRPGPAKCRRQVLGRMTHGGLSMKGRDFLKFFVFSRFFSYFYDKLLTVTNLRGTIFVFQP